MISILDFEQLRLYTAQRNLLACCSPHLSTKRVREMVILLLECSSPISDPSPSKSILTTLSTLTWRTQRHTPNQHTLISNNYSHNRCCLPCPWVVMTRPLAFERASRLQLGWHGPDPPVWCELKQHRWLLAKSGNAIGIYWDIQWCIWLYMYILGVYITNSTMLRSNNFMQTQSISIHHAAKWHMLQRVARRWSSENANLKKKAE
jgi:hypothetical protein